MQYTLLYINLIQLFPNMGKIFEHKKEKIMALKGRSSVISQIIINNIIEGINTFNCRGCTIAYQNEKVITVKISEFLQIIGFVNRTSNLLKSKPTLD